MIVNELALLAALFRLLRREAGGSYGSLACGVGHLRSRLRDKDGSTDEHLYPDPDGFVVDTPMGRYSGATEMIEMSKTPVEYKHPLTRWVRGNQAGSNRSELKSNWKGQAT
jgi:hypothetical protein